MDNAITDLRRLIDDAKQILILGHSSPDGDCLGAMLAWAAALDQLQKPCKPALPDPVPTSLAFLPGSNRVLVAPPSLPAADLAIVPDCGDLGRLGPLYETNAAMLEAMPLVNVDHHASNAYFGTLNLVDPTAAAVCEQLFFLFPALGVTLDTNLATCLLTGIVTDTQAFRTPNVTPRTMRVATALVEAGAPLRQIADQAYNSRQLSSLRLWGMALSQIEELDGVVWTRLNEDMLSAAGAGWEESEALVNLLSSAQTAKVAILFKEMPDGKVRVSLRSNGAVDVAAVARDFEGGGHKGAAGCTLAVSVPEARQALIQRVRTALQTAIAASE